MTLVINGMDDCMRHEPRVNVAVTDSGTSIPADPACLFEPFFSSKLHVMGNGLSIPRIIVELHFRLHPL
jgi:C4-dicarboxylate-specific signal transduction histidine kinase